MNTETPLEPTTEEQLAEARDLLAGAGKKFSYLNRLSSQLRRSGNPARRAAGEEINHILTMEEV